MKRWILASLVSACLPFMAVAQVVDDLYYVPKKKEAVKKTEKTVAAPATVQPVKSTGQQTGKVTSVVVKDAGGQVRDIDEYNRRYTSRDSEFSVEDETLVVQEKPYEERGEWVNGEFEGTQSDYEYAMRIVRFRNPRYAIPVSSPIYWDVVYGGLYPSWQWNVYDDGMYAYVFPTYSNRLWWDWRWGSHGWGWNFSFGWSSPWYYSHWYSPYYCGYWGSYWGPAWHHHHYYHHHYHPYYGGWYGGYYGYRPSDRNPSGRYQGSGGYRRPDSGISSGRYNGSDGYRRPGSGISTGRRSSTSSGIAAGSGSTGGRNYSTVRSDRTGRVRSTGRVVSPSSNSGVTGVRPVSSGSVNRGTRTDPRRGVGFGAAGGSSRSAYTRPNSYIRQGSSSSMNGTRSTYTRPSSTRTSVNRASTRSFNNNNSFSNSRRSSNSSSFNRSSGSSFRSSGASFGGGGGRSSGGGGGRSGGGAGGGRR